MPKKKEFTLANPLVVRIKEIAAGQWDIQPDGQHVPKMKDRLAEKDNDNQSLKDHIVIDWGRRHGDPKGPHFVKDPLHVPIVMREGEYLRFVCDHNFAFEISADRDGDVDPVANAPSNPFGWQTAQSVRSGSTLFAAVIMPPVDSNGDATGIGPNDQGFFKFSAVIHDSVLNQDFDVDPDGYCDR